MRFYLMDCARAVEDEIALGAKQSDVALTYAMAIQSAAAKVWEADWPRLNRAILNRWSMSGLERVKAKAFKLLREQEKTRTELV